jgi:hypothetical protein
MSQAKSPPYVGDNPILKHFAVLRPQLWQSPEWERVAFILANSITKSSMNNKPTWDELTDALAEIVPEQREFWLRVQATWNTQFIEAMTFMFKEEIKS